MSIKNARHQENIHILFWLVKDSCWMMQFKELATMMIIPTIGIAIWILIQSRKSFKRFLPNLAVLFWITANAFWMLDEFYALSLINYSLVLFCLGIISILSYVYIILTAPKPRPNNE
jgi:hypothetical protein